jgi:tetratricopeptide (TPR) repeat protein
MSLVHRIALASVLSLVVVIIGGTSAAQESGWTGVKLKKTPVSYGRISSAGTRLAVEGKFNDLNRAYQVIDEQEQFVKISDGVESGWVFRFNLTRAETVAPGAPEVTSESLPQRDPLIGQLVFCKDSAVAKVGGQVVDEFEVLTWPATVGDVNGDWLWLGRAWVRRSEVMSPQEAFDYCVEEVRRNPKSAIAWRRRAVCWKERGELDNAIRDYDEAIRLDPKYALAYQSRGNAKRGKLDYDGAIGDYDEAIRLDPKNAWAYNNRGNAKRGKLDYDGAILDYDEATRLDPRMASAFNSRGNAKHGKLDYDGAIRDYDEAIRLDPQRASSYYNRGLAKSNKLDYDGAISDYDEAIELDPTLAWAFRNRGNASRDKQDHDAAIGDYNEAIRLDPNDAFAHFNRSVCRMLLRRDGSTESFQSVLDAEGWEGGLANVAAVLGCLSGRLASEKERGERYLEESRGKHRQEWPHPAVRYLRGELDEPELLALATDNDKQTQARCFIALNQIADQKPELARAHLAWVRDDGNKTSIEHGIAVAELKRLNRTSPSSGQPTVQPSPVRRVLTDVTGEKQVTVDVLAFDGSMVRVKKLDGKETSVPIDKLSEDDRLWLRTKF